jgi:hypothetical protein
VLYVLDAVLDGPSVLRVGTHGKGTKVIQGDLQQKRRCYARQTA